MRIKLLFCFFVLLAVLALSCGGGRKDPLSSDQNATKYGGSLTLGAGRANTPVSEETKLPICQILNSEIYGLCLRSLNGISNTPQSVDSLSITRLSGGYSGYVTVLGRKDLRSDNKTADFNFKITFFDFSDSGSVFMGGELGVSGYIVAQGSNISSIRIVLSDGLAFTGNYTGAVEYNSMRLPIDSSGLITSVYASKAELRYYAVEGSQTLIYGDTSFRFNPYYRSPMPD
jgi:hypothetical protein